MLIYSFILPIMEQLSAVIIQWLENVKGKLMVNASKLQVEINDIAKDEDNDNLSGQVTNVIGFAIPDEVDYEEDYDDDEE